MRTQHGYSVYSQNNAGVESPQRLTEMLYEGALRFTAQAKKSIQNRDIEKKVYWINRTIAIYSELINSLNYSAGDIAHYLSGIYNREIQLLTQANIKNDIASIDEVLHVTRELLEAWRDNVLEPKEVKNAKVG